MYVCVCVRVRVCVCVCDGRQVLRCLEVSPAQAGKELDDLMLTMLLRVRLRRCVA